MSFLQITIGHSAVSFCLFSGCRVGGLAWVAMARWMLRCCGKTQHDFITINVLYDIFRTSHDRHDHFTTILENR
jgi:hypothetical protein